MWGIKKSLIRLGLAIPVFFVLMVLTSNSASAGISYDSSTRTITVTGTYTVSDLYRADREGTLVLKKAETYDTNGSMRLETELRPAEAMALRLDIDVTSLTGDMIFTFVGQDAERGYQEDPVELTAPMGLMRYMRSDQHTVNTITAHVLGTSRTTTAEYRELTMEGLSTVGWGIRVYKVASDGTLTEITKGEPVAQVWRASTGAGLQDEWWECPRTTLETTDAILIEVYAYLEEVEEWQLLERFITTQLNKTLLPRCTWRVYYYTEFLYSEETNTTTARYWWGSKSYDGRILPRKFKTMASFSRVSSIVRSGIESGESVRCSINQSRWGEISYWEDPVEGYACSAKLVIGDGTALTTFKLPDTVKQWTISSDSPQISVKGNAKFIVGEVTNIAEKLTGKTVSFNSTTFTTIKGEAGSEIYLYGVQWRGGGFSLKGSVQRVWNTQFSDTRLHGENLDWYNSDIFKSWHGLDVWDTYIGGTFERIDMINVSTIFLGIREFLPPR